MSLVVIYFGKIMQHPGYQVLQHPYFQEQRAAEKQAPARDRRKAVFSERPMAPELLSNTWQTAQKGQRQKQPLPEA